MAPEHLVPLLTTTPSHHFDGNLDSLSLTFKIITDNPLPRATLDRLRSLWGEKCPDFTPLHWPPINQDHKEVTAFYGVWPEGYGQNKTPSSSKGLNNLLKNVQTD